MKQMIYLSVLLVTTYTSVPMDHVQTECPDGTLDNCVAQVSARVDAYIPDKNNTPLIIGLIERLGQQGKADDYARLAHVVRYGVYQLHGGVSLVKVAKQMKLKRPGMLIIERAFQITEEHNESLMLARFRDDRILQTVPE